MTKKYRHRKLGWIAELNNPFEVEGGFDDGVYTLKNNDVITGNNVRAKLIEDSNDWELIEDKDWIDEVIETYNRNYTHINDHKIRQAIKKHMPKVSEEELFEIIGPLECGKKIIDLLKSKGLLAD